MLIKFPFFAAMISIIASVMIIIGWIFNIPEMEGIFSFWLPMKPNAAICFILLGSAIILSNYLPSHVSETTKKYSFYIGQFFIILVVIVNFLMLSEYALGLNFGIDELLFDDPVEKFSSQNPLKNKLEVSYPGRIKLEAAICFLLLSFALIHSESNYWRVISSSLGIFVLAISLATLSSYLTPELGQFGWFGYGIMRINATVLFIILGAATALITWQQNVLSWSLNKHITLTFIFSLFLLVLIGFNISRTQFWLQSVNYEIEQNEHIGSQLKNILISTSNAQTNTRGYLLTKNAKFSDGYAQAKEEASKRVSHLRNVECHTNDLISQNDCMQIEVMVNEQFAWYQSMMELRKNNESIPNEKIFYGAYLLEQLHHFVERIEQNYQKRIFQLKKSSTRIPTLLYSLICFGTLTSVIILFAGIFILNVMECKRKKAQEEIHRMAFYDSLTQLPNRRFLYERLQHDIAIYKRKGNHIAVLMMDLDKFKIVNDTLGHLAGDDLLKQVAKRIVTGLRDSDMVARLGGDEFVVVLMSLTEQLDAATVALKIIDDLSQPFTLNNENTVEIGASIGISFYPENGCTVDDLISHADTALYQAKNNGRGCFAYFSNEC